MESVYEIGETGEAEKTERKVAVAKTQRKPRGWGKFADLARKLVQVPKSEAVEPKKPKRRKK